VRSIWLPVVLSAVVAGLALWPACSLAASETWNNEGAQRAAEEAPRLEAEREAKHREEVERPAKEAAEKAAHESEIREAGERTGREVTERSAREAAERAAALRRERCVVPRLRGDSPTAARRALHSVHCELGQVTAPRNHRGALIVARQSVRAGRTLAGGAKVAIVLVPKRG
jgi:peptidoglycan DL-endopeptidase CwlO